VNRRRVIALLLTAVVAIGLVSTTLGRAIYAGQTPGLVSFAAIHFAGYLFFLLMPVEALIPIYQAEGHRGATLIVIALATAVAAQLIDYCIGRAVSDRVIDDLIGEDRYRKFSGKIERWGGWAILLFNLFPLSSPNMLLVAGMVRYNVWKTFAFSTMGLVGKYVGIVYIFDAATWWLSRTQ
jgi:membrane protein YqaA with SNARE-associated domain